MHFGQLYRNRILHVELLALNRQLPFSDNLISHQGAFFRPRNVHNFDARIGKQLEIREASQRVDVFFVRLYDSPAGAN